MSLSHVCKWIKHFKAGQRDMHSEQRTVHPRDSINDETVA